MEQDSTKGQQNEPSYLIHDSDHTPSLLEKYLSGGRCTLCPHYFKMAQEPAAALRTLLYVEIVRTTLPPGHCIRAGTVIDPQLTSMLISLHSHC